MQTLPICLAPVAFDGARSSSRLHIALPTAAGLGVSREPDAAKGFDELVVRATPGKLP